MIKELPFSEQSALFARFSNLAYQAPKEATKLFKKAGFEEVTYYGNDGSNAYVIESKDDVVVVCRGTEVKEWNDIRADLSIALTPSRTGIGKVHRGFRTYTDKIWEPIKSHISPIKNKDIWFTGHSLGAAMATLMARRCVLDISISGGGGGASVVYDATVFAYKNVIDSNIDLDLPYKTAVIYVDPNVTVDIESGSTLSVSDGVIFSIIEI